MARVIAPFKIVGTLDELEFYVTDDGQNYVKTKGNPGITKEQFKQNPIFQSVKNHGIEFGKCTKKAQNFRNIAVAFNSRAKDGSFAGRANKLMLEIVNEDALNEKGKRTVENGMQSEEAFTYFVGFEGNKMRPIKTVLKRKWIYDEKNNQFSLKNFNPKKQLDWPEEAEQVHFAIARANWNYIDNKFDTIYSEEIIINKEEKPQDIILISAIPEGQHIELTYLFIGFSKLDRKKVKELKRSNNMVSIIWSNKIS